MARLHLVSLPHTATSRAYSWCAYTQKVVHFSAMLTSLGHEVTLYAAEENEAACAELVVCADHPVSTPTIPQFDSSSPLFANFNQRAIDAMRDRIQPRDIICIIGGLAQKPVADAFPDHITIEFGVGYGGVFAPYRVFESYAWMHTVYGALSGGDPHSIDGRFYDAVIPNSFEVQDFPAGEHDGDYLLYVGRMVDRKGIGVAKQIADAAGLPLKTAGIGQPPEGVEHQGVVGPVERAELMGGARALLAPTLYVEPFGGAVVEAMLTGCPVITTDFGAFTETNINGLTGFRCRTLAGFVQAVDQVADLDPQSIRQYAVDRYSTDTVRWQYDTYLRQIETLWGDGWHTMPEVASRVA